MKLLLTGGMKGGNETYFIRRKDDNRFVRQVAKNLGAYSYVDVPALSITRGRRLPGQDRLSPLIEFLAGLPQRLSIIGKDGFQKKGSFSTSADLLEEQLPGLIHSGEAEAGVHHEMIKLQEVAQALLQMLQHLQGGASIVTPCALAMDVSQVSPSSHSSVFLTSSDGGSWWILKDVYNFLRAENIRAFMGRDPRKGEDFSIDARDAIQRSIIFIPLFSHDCAMNEHFLDEVALMHERTERAEAA
ncbi:hypothetical protein SAY87_007275 [Trapa incisa]|uniref:TIR domain-containing protein n=1 Tax=Trapa incisa TaxID=236973 RepID=A0AAN7K434_9MYRT|nr:hypothetical protein SAY87_007275 [Trapa incisa]